MLNGLRRLLFVAISFLQVGLITHQIIVLGSANKPSYRSHNKNKTSLFQHE